MIPLIGISGKAHSGKTTLGNKLANMFGWKHLSLAAVLKEKAKKEFGLTDNDVNGPGKECSSPYLHSDDVTPLTNREVLIRLGLAYRSIDKNFWISQLPIDPNRVNVISDVRFKNEANFIRSNGGIIVRLERAVELKGPDIDDRSETDLDDYKFDLRILESMNCDLNDITGIAYRVEELVNLYDQKATA